MKKKSLNIKLVVGGVLAVLVPTLFVGAFSFTKASGFIRILIEDHLKDQAANLANTVQNVVNEELKLTRVYGGAEVLRAMLAKVKASGKDAAGSEIGATHGILAEIKQQVGDELENVLVTDAGGTVIMDSSGGMKESPLVGVLNLQKAAKGESVVLAPERSKQTGNLVLPIYIPVYGAGGELLGSVVNIVSMNFITKKIASDRVGQHGYAVMVDANGVPIAHPNEKLILGASIKNKAGMEKLAAGALSGKNGIAYYTLGETDMISGYAPVPLTGWSVMTNLPEMDLQALTSRLRNIILVGILIFVIVVVVAVLIFARSIIRPIQTIIDVLTGGAHQVAEASVQIADAGQSLAEGASEQAASIEETSSSLEEMASMTRQNAENAAQADGLMKETNGVVSAAVAAMEELTSSMAEISRASEETAKIIKTIDEIAFQTNLLALNAAVEAARAGEAGAGFAVVADEVRNLAMRAAAAARNTADLIEGTVKKISDGEKIVDKTSATFAQVAQNSSKAGNLVSEIAAASNEQAAGIEQLNRAVTQMDKVVQQNAANAEETASVGEEMNARSTEMREVVKELVTLVMGETVTPRIQTGDFSSAGNVAPRLHGAGQKALPPSLTGRG